MSTEEQRLRWKIAYDMYHKKNYSLAQVARTMEISRTRARQMVTRWEAQLAIVKENKQKYA